MFKKLMLLMSCVGLLALVACSGEEAYEPDPDPIAEEPEPDSEPIEEEPVEFEFSIEIISEDEFENLEYYNEVNYALARDEFITEGLNLLFDFNEPVTDFSLIEVVELEDGSFAKTGVLYEVGDLDPDTPLVITYYFGYGTIPFSGFYFTGPAGVGGWFTFQQDAVDGEMVWSPFDWSHDYDLFVVDDEYETDEVVAEEPVIEDQTQEPENLENDIRPSELFTRSREQIVQQFGEPLSEGTVQGSSYTRYDGVVFHFPLLAPDDDNVAPTSIVIFNEDITIDGISWNYERDMLGTMFGEIIDEGYSIYMEAHFVTIQYGEYIISFSMHDENSVASSAWITNPDF